MEELRERKKRRRIILFKIFCFFSIPTALVGYWTGYLYILLGLWIGDGSPILKGNQFSEWLYNDHSIFTEITRKIYETAVGPFFYRIEELIHTNLPSFLSTILGIQVGVFEYFILSFTKNALLMGGLLIIFKGIPFAIRLFNESKEEASIKQWRARQGK